MEGDADTCFVHDCLYRAEYPEFQNQTAVKQEENDNEDNIFPDQEGIYSDFQG